MKGKNYMKKFIALFIAIFMIVTNITVVFAAETKIRITDKDGKERKTDEPIKAGEEIIMEYTLYPDDINKKPDKKDIGVTFVVDLSGSMRRLDVPRAGFEGLTYGGFMNKYMKSYGNYDKWKAERTHKSGLVTYVDGAPQAYNGYYLESTMKRDFNSWFSKRFYLYFNENGIKREGWYTNQEAWEIFSELCCESRIDVEKRELVNFLNNLEKYSNINTSISIVGFESNIRVDENNIGIQRAKGIANSLSPVGSTNGGLGLKTAYYNNQNYNDRTNFVIYISDGANSSFVANGGNYRVNQQERKIDNFVQSGYNQYPAYHPTYFPNNMNINNFYLGKDKNGGAFFHSAEISYNTSRGEYFEFIDNSAIDYLFVGKKADVSWSARDSKYYIKNYYTYSIFDFRLPRKYAFTVAQDLIGSKKSNIEKTYVVGIGDEQLEDQKVENMAIAGLANGILDWDKKNNVIYKQRETADAELSEVYFPLSNAAGLKYAFDSIIDDIVNTVKTTDNEIEIPFKTDIVFKDDMNKGKKSKDSVVVTKVEVEEILDEKNDKFRVLEIEEMEIDDTNKGGNKVFSLKCELAEGFSYKYSDESKKYVANPVRVKIHMSVPKDSTQDGIEVVDGGKLEYKVFGEKGAVTIPKRNFIIYRNIINLVDATLIINKDGSGILNLKALSDLNNVAIRFADKKSVAGLKDIGKLRINEEKKINLTDDMIYDFSKDMKFLIELEKNNNGSKNTYYEEVNLLLIGKKGNNGKGEYLNIESGVNYAKQEYINKDSDTKRKVGLQVNALEGLEAITVNLDGNSNMYKVSYTDGGKNTGYYEQAIVMSGYNYLKNIKGIENGANSLTLSIENDYSNKTILHKDVKIYAKRPEFNNIAINDGILTADLTDISNDLQGKGLVTISQNKGVAKTYFITNTNVQNPRKLSVNINENINGKVKIDVYDKYNNFSVTEPMFELKTGLYNRSTNTFMPDTTEVVFGYRYSYAVEVEYSGKGDIIFEAYNSNNANNKIKAKGLDKFTLIRQDNKQEYKEGFLIGNKDGRVEFYKKYDKVVPAGKYLLIFDVIFEKPALKVENMAARVTYNGQVIKNIPIGSAPNLQ